MRQIKRKIFILVRLVITDCFFEIQRTSIKIAMVINTTAAARERSEFEEVTGPAVICHRQRPAPRRRSRSCGQRLVKTFAAQLFHGIDGFLGGTVATRIALYK